MKERLERHELPSKMGGKKTYLPPIEVVVVDGVEIGVHPDYKDRLLEIMGGIISRGEINKATGL